MPRAARVLTLLRHRDDSPEAYLYDYQGDESATHTALLMPAGAGRFAHPGTETPALYWGVGATRSRFAATHPLDTLIAHLTPVETDFPAATEHRDEAAGDGRPGHTPDLLDPALRPALRPDRRPQAEQPGGPLSTR
ncbi:hypothetical protein [Streptomyces scabiei]|uniref:hypothetical protein n=1 Tax=Streptomyces scabiei TaxID=1930 RepID=UPI0007775B9C|nr:hypothetical protein [Streptomyces scabiei]MDX2539310.1 hypothetical protein [Streptomyces scabiei]MDX2802719.1 hypothetical protein [Streptomyces scabiei]MDX2861985.1 hypothetical protein [Streptomyces scabiei]MDX3830674.1 hypothetical protein [Streptomyces scabiei]